LAFKNENAQVGLPVDSEQQIGRSNYDPDQNIEDRVLLPSPSTVEGSYVYYECNVGAMLDSGIVVHNRLPQVDRTPDTLSSVSLDDPNIGQATEVGVNLRCMDQYRDIVQRMGHARYWFRLWGQAMRVGRQVPIPSIKTIGGVLAIPYDLNPQWAYNRIAPSGNYSGVILWHAVWSLWYTTIVPPTNNTIPAVDLAAGIDGNARVPDGIQAPYSQPDSNASQQAELRTNRVPFIGRV
jgi:hypothetical protein